jgi:hypothetical protein
MASYRTTKTHCILSHQSITPHYYKLRNLHKLKSYSQTQSITTTINIAQCPLPLSLPIFLSLKKKKTQQLPATQTTELSPAPTFVASTSHLQIEEILLLLRSRGVVGMIDLEMIEE